MRRSRGGNSPNVLKALQVARQYGASTIGFSGQNGGQLRQLVDYGVFVPSDHIGQQEDGHMILDHVISSALHQLIKAEAASAQIGIEQGLGA
jgi:D-sedoheptulose 7-phosphate isomerase